MLRRNSKRLIQAGLVVVALALLAQIAWRFHEGNEGVDAANLLGLCFVAVFIALLQVQKVREDRGTGADETRKD